MLTSIACYLLFFCNTSAQTSPCVSIYYVITKLFFLIVYRWYNGLESNIVVKDLDMLQQIMIKEFDVFMDRSVRNCHCFKIA